MSTIKNTPLIVIAKNLSAGMKFIIGMFIASMFVSIVVFAAPPTSKYSPGETVSPNCSPGDTNCTVRTPAVSGSNSDITELTGLTTDLSVNQGGTGASTASGARTGLGLVIGTNIQAYNSYLADISGITANKGDIIYFNGTNWVNLGYGTSGQYLKTQGSGANPTWASVGGGGDLISTNNLSDLSNTTTARTNLGLAIGSDVQAYDAQLADIAGLTPTNSYLIIADGSNFNATAMSGDGTIGSNGSLSISANAVALGADTTGNYLQSLASGIGLSGGSTGSEGSVLTLSLDINGLTSESAVNDTDSIAVYDASAAAIRKMTRANFLSGVTGALIYQGAWDATANTPSLSDATGSKGNYYVVSVAGSQNLGSGSISFTVGDWVIDNGSIWEKLDSVNDVQSVFGRNGVITAGSGDYTATQITNIATGNIASTNVQNAINELDTEKQPLDAQLTDVAGLAVIDGNIIVGNGTNFVAESGATARTSLGLSNVENTALSTWVGTPNITTLGTIGAGVWQGTAIGDSYISSASTWNSKQTGNAYLTDIAGITANQGDVIYFNGTNWVDLAPGTSGQYLKTQGAGANPVWGTVSGSGTVYSADGTIGSGRAVAITDTVNFDSNTFVIDGTNNKVGIGTTTPTQKLEVVGSDAKILVLGSVGAAIQLKYATDGSWSEWQQTGDRTRLDANGAGDVFTILNAGNVGIGDSAPDVKLEVNGQIRAKGANPAGGGGYSFTSPGDTDGGMFSTADGQIEFYTNNVERVRIDSSGRVGIGTTPVIDLAIGDADTGFNWASDGILDIYANNALMARIDGNGISSGGFAGRLKKVSGGTYEVPADGTEYYSPDQQGGKYGTVYRMYIAPSWINGYNFVSIGANGSLINTALQVLNTANSEEEVITDVSYSDVYRARIVKSTANNYLILHVGTGYTLLGGWVDYSK